MIVTLIVTTTIIITIIIIISIILASNDDDNDDYAGGSVTPLDNDRTRRLFLTFAPQLLPASDQSSSLS